MANLVNIHHVINHTVSKFGLRQVESLPYQDMMMWAFNALKQIGPNTAYVKKVEKVKVSNYRGYFPLDLQRVERIKGYPIFRSSNQYFEIDTRDTEVELEYTAFAMDEDGPLFPDDVSLMEAVSWFLAYNLSLQDKLPNRRLDPGYCDSQWQWYCGQARAESMKPSIDQMNRISNTFHRLVPDRREYANNFRGMDYPDDFGGRNMNKIK